MEYNTTLLSFYPEKTSAALSCSFVLNDQMYIAGGGIYTGFSRQLSRVNINGNCGLGKSL